MTEETSNRLPRPIPPHKIDMVRAAAVAVVKKELTAIEKEAKDALTKVMDPGDSCRAVLPGWGDMGTVYRTADSNAATVVDPDAWLAWVEENRPGEIVRSVRTSYEAAILAQVDTDGEPLVRDAKGKPTGEVIPGIGFKPRKGYIAVKQTEEQAATVARAFRDGILSARGEIDPPDMVQIRTGGSDDPIAVIPLRP